MSQDFGIADGKGKLSVGHSTALKPTWMKRSLTVEDTWNLFPCKNYMIGEQKMFKNRIWNK